MKALHKYMYFIIIAFAFTSCNALEDGFGAASNKYDLQYSVESLDNSINKIVYTDINGNTTIANKIDNNWKIKATSKSGQTIKLEVFGENQNADIELQIYAKNGEKTVERSIVKKKNTKKYFHYYIIHVLE